MNTFTDLTNLLSTAGMTFDVVFDGEFDGCPFEETPAIAA